MFNFVLFSVKIHRQSAILSVHAVWHRICKTNGIQISRDYLPKSVNYKINNKKNILFMAKGNIGVTSDNIFPVIKKFLYSDHEIFLREIISNAVDATQKLKTLAAVGEFKGELGDLTIRVSVDPKKKKLTVSDRGIGMTAEEIDKVGANTERYAYNTRANGGLPPGPISAPGLSALQAAAQPDEAGNYLYFVASCEKPGSHKFAATFEEFSRYEQEYLACPKP